MSDISRGSLSAQHRHECEENPHGDDGRLCDERGYHQCGCGATCGASESSNENPSEWIKSHAVAGFPGRYNPEFA